MPKLQMNMSGAVIPYNSYLCKPFPNISDNSITAPKIKNWYRLIKTAR